MIARGSECCGSFGTWGCGARSPSLADVRRRLPFTIRKIQTDHGAEFPLEFVLTLHEAGIRHWYIRPRRPQQNGKVERSHRIDQEEFWGRRRFETFLEADTALQAWERVSNLERFSLALRGETPGGETRPTPPRHAGGLIIPMPSVRCSRQPHPTGGPFPTGLERTERL